MHVDNYYLIKKGECQEKLRVQGFKGRGAKCMSEKLKSYKDLKVWQRGLRSQGVKESGVPRWRDLRFTTTSEKL
jgi:hypothetical protein